MSEPMPDLSPIKNRKLRNFTKQFLRLRYLLNSFVQEPLEADPLRQNGPRSGSQLVGQSAMGGAIPQDLERYYNSRKVIDDTENWWAHVMELDDNPDTEFLTEVSPEGNFIPKTLGEFEPVVGDLIIDRVSHQIYLVGLSGEGWIVKYDTRGVATPIVFGDETIHQFAYLYINKGARPNA